MEKPTRFRIEHFPQVPCKPFIVECESYEEAKKVSDSLCYYDLFLLDNNHRCDYANMSCIEYYDNELQDWCTYEPEDWEDYD